MAQQAVEAALPPNGEEFVFDGVYVTVGEQMTHGQLAALPVGSTVWNGPAEVAEDHWTKISDEGYEGYGRWQHSSTGAEQTYLADEFNALRSVGDGAALPLDGTVLTCNGLNYTVGEPVDQHGMDHLPFGSTVWNGHSRGSYWTKVEADANRWQNSRGVFGRRPQALAVGYNHLRSVPQVGYVFGEALLPEVWPQVGALVGGRGEELPVGTTVNSTTRLGMFWTKTQMEGNLWESDDGRWHDRRMEFTTGQTIRSLPDGVAAAEPEQVYAPATLAEFKGVFATAVMDLTEQYTEAHQREARRILTMLDRAHDAPAITPEHGTVATHGRPDQKDFTVFRYGRRGWVKIMGALEYSEGLALSVPGGEAGESALIEAYKNDAWAAGQEAKQDQKWCSAYDHLLARFGITDPGPRPDFSAWGTLVKGEEGRAELPVGAVLGVDRGDWGIFIKTEMPNTWRRVCGTRPLAAGTMRLLCPGGGDMDIRPVSPLLEFLPAGSQISTRRHAYTKVAGVWAGAGNSYRSDQFDDNRTRVSAL